MKDNIIKEYHLKDYLEVTKKVNIGVHVLQLGHSYKFVIMLHQTIEVLVEAILKRNIVLLEVSPRTLERAYKYAMNNYHPHNTEEFEQKINKLKENNNLISNEDVYCNFIVAYNQ